MPAISESSRAQQDIMQLARDCTSDAVSGLTVHVDETCVLIGGRADSYYVKQLVTQVALAKSHGRSVRNDIHVQTRR